MKLALILITSTLFTGCAQFGDYMIARAKNPSLYADEPNYGPSTTTCRGTGDIRTCTTSQFGSPYTPKTTTCSGTGSVRTCTTF